MPEPEIKLDFCKRSAELLGYDFCIYNPKYNDWERWYTCPQSKGCVMEGMRQTAANFPHTKFKLVAIYKPYDNANTRIIMDA